MNIITKASPNHNERASGTDIRYLILHYTGTKSAAEAEAVYMDGGLELSPHYMLDTDGTITNFVSEDKRAWHAGRAKFEGFDDLNSRSIGIEIVNHGHDGNLPAFPEKQIAALIELTNDIVTRNAISPFHVLGHSDIAAGRKIDPGEHFPWERLAKAGIGVWPEPVQGDFDADLGLRLALHEYGYDNGLEDIVLVREFQRHFEPEIFAHGKQGQVTTRTHALANCLLRLKRAAFS